MIKANLFKIKKGKVKKWKEWCQLLNTTYRKEAIKTLKEEGLSWEGFSVFELDGKNYTLGFSEGKHLQANTNNKLNQKHKNTKQECLIYIKEIKFSYEVNTG